MNELILTTLPEGISESFLSMYEDISLGTFILSSLEIYH